jgi:hypothetical protein
VVNSNGDDECLTTGKIVAVKSIEDIMLRNIFRRCITCGYIEFRKDTKGNFTDFIHITEKWKEL